MNGTVHVPSGRLGRGPLLALLLVPATLVLALAYGYADVYFPLRHPLVSACLLGAYTVALCLLVGHLRSWGGVESAGFMLALGPAVGLFALYAAWAAFGAAYLARFARPGTSMPGYLDLLLRPDLVWRLARTINEHGWFTLGPVTPAGPLLWILWGLEAATIVGGPTAVTREVTRDQVLCEECRVWCVDDERRPFFAAPVEPAALERAIDGDTAALQALPEPSESARTFVSLDLKRCPGCKRFATSVLRVVEISVNGQGQRSYAKADLSPRFVVEPDTYERLAALAKRP